MISNPGANPNLPPGAGGRHGLHLGRRDPPAVVRRQRDGLRLQVAPDLGERPGDRPAARRRFPGHARGHLRQRPQQRLRPQRRSASHRCGRCRTGGLLRRRSATNAELNPDGGAGIYVIDNTSDGLQLQRDRAAAQRRSTSGWRPSVAYSYTQAKNNLRSSEIASVLWSSQPIQGNPNNPELSYSEFGQRHRIVGRAPRTSSPGRPACVRRSASSSKWPRGTASPARAATGTRSSTPGDVNGDGAGGNDLIYIPRDQSEIVFADCATAVRRERHPAAAVGRAQRLHRAGQVPAASIAVRSPSGPAR